MLSVIIIPRYMYSTIEEGHFLALALEQYYLLEPHYNLNASKVSIGGSKIPHTRETIELLIRYATERLENLYVYNIDKTALLHVFDSLIIMAHKLNVSYYTLRGATRNRSLFHRVFFITRGNQYPNAEKRLMTVDQLRGLVHGETASKSPIYVTEYIYTLIDTFNNNNTVRMNSIYKISNYTAQFPERHQQ